MTLTSPPYDNIRDYNGYVFDYESIIKQLYRVTKKGGVVVWVVNDSTINGSQTGNSFRQALYFKEVGFNIHDTMIWNKPSFSFPSLNRYHQIYQYMFVFSKGKPKTFNPIMDKINKHRAPLGKHTFRKKDGNMCETDKKVNYGQFGKRTNIWDMNTTSQQNMCKQASKHPAMFPKILAHDHIISWSNQGDVILDPMCGGGTTLHQAKRLNRKYIGIDISKEYCELSQQMVDSVTL